MIAEEKLSIGVTETLPAAMQRELANFREVRKIDGFPGLTGRQALCWGRRRFSRDEVRDGTSALRAMLALRGAARKESIPRIGFSNLMQQLDANMTLPSALDFSEVDKLVMLEDVLNVCPDFSQQFAFSQENAEGSEIL